MNKKTIFAIFVLGGLIAVLLLIAGIKKLQFQAMADAGGPMAEANKLIKEADELMKKASELMQMPAQSVSTSIVERQLWGEKLQAIGSIEPVQGVRLDAEVPGVVSAINFKNGQEVNQGDMLVQLDIAPEAALLKSDKANAQLAKIELDRAQRLRDTNSVAQSELDRAQANYEIALAQVKNIEAIIEQKTIRAPFTGRVGIRQINLGQYLSSGTPIVTLQSYNRVFVNFTLPQQVIGRVDTGMLIDLKSDAYPEKTFRGSVTAISPQINSATRTIEMQGTLDNADGYLRPGLFVNVSVTLSESNEVIVIPSTAIIYAPYGNSIFKINKQTDETTGKMITTVKQSFIRIGKRKGDFVSVLEGLEADDEVVSAGAFKLRNEMPVSIQNDLAPSPELAPTPNNS
jgi:membrane fusion protein (multidrug efflux system)